MCRDWDGKIKDVIFQCWNQQATSHRYEHWLCEIWNRNFKAYINYCIDNVQSTTWPDRGTRYNHDDVTKWKRFVHYWPYVREIYRRPTDSPHKGQWRRALMFSLICAWTNSWANNRGASDLRRLCAHHDVTIMRVCRLVGASQTRSIYATYQPVNNWKLMGAYSSLWLLMPMHQTISIHNADSIFFVLDLIDKDLWRF